MNRLHLKVYFLPIFFILICLCACHENSKKDYDERCTDKDVRMVYDKAPCDFGELNDIFHKCFHSELGIERTGLRNITERRMKYLQGPQNVSYEYESILAKYEKDKYKFLVKITWDSEVAISERDVLKKSLDYPINEGVALTVGTMKKSGRIPGCQSCYESPYFYWDKNPYHIPLIRYYNRNFKVDFDFKNTIKESNWTEAKKVLNVAFSCMEKSIDQFYKEREQGRGMEEEKDGSSDVPDGSGE